MKHFYTFCFFFLLICNTTLIAHDKWIVVTTINYPTEALLKLAEQKDWKLVVVGDKKTPKDWTLENCIYLSPDDQVKLNYQTAKYLKWNHYCRKLIGYLYAIEHGAKYIYETDDDNILKDSIKIIEDNEIAGSLYSHSTLAANVYFHFGETKAWPRGYPLEWITKGNKFSLIPAIDAKIGVQQGLVDKEADVDAIFRLTIGEEIYFADRPPCTLAKQTYCPFNSQNTVYHYDAFWGLFLPSTAAFRTTDILRSFITQRLLWDLNQTICFTTSTAIQDRNPHNFLKDFEDEILLYTSAGKIITLLNTWHDSSPLFQTRMTKLYHALVVKNYLNKLEEEVIQAWITDLNNLGYEWPKVQP